MLPPDGLWIILSDDFWKETMLSRFSNTFLDLKRSTPYFNYFQKETETSLAILSKPLHSFQWINSTTLRKNMLFFLFWGLLLFIKAYFGYCSVMTGGKDTVVLRAQQEESTESLGREGEYPICFPSVFMCI